MEDIVEIQSDEEERAVPEVEVLEIMSSTSSSSNDEGGDGGMTVRYLGRQRLTDGLIFVIDGKPIAYRTWRYRVASNSARNSYNPNGRAAQQLRLAIRNCLEQEGLSIPVFPGPVSVEVTFSLARPRSHHVGNDPNRPLKSNVPRHPCTRPDLDNYWKFLGDVMNQVVYIDDRQVVQMTLRKVYSSGSVSCSRVSVRPV